MKKRLGGLGGWSENGAMRFEFDSCSRPFYGG
jgi:hypothetical protein